MLRKVSKRNRITIIFFSLLIVSLLLMSFDVKKRGKLNMMEELLIDTASVAQKGLTYSLQSFRDLWLGYVYLVDLREENLKLKRETSELREKLNSAREAVKENQRLKDLLTFKESYSYGTITARVIGIDPTNLFKTVTIERGSTDGVKKGMAVVTKEGVVGRVISSSANSSRVLLITDRNSDVDAVIQRSRDRGIAEGGDLEVMQLKYLARSADVQARDILVTSGVGGIFPKGLVIGYVSKLDRGGTGLFLSAEITPAVTFSKLEEVLVITEFQFPEVNGV